MRFLRQVVFNNFALKVLALAVSVYLWAAYTGQPIAEFGYDVPIVFINVPPDLAIASETPARAHLVIQGHPALMRRLTPSDLALYADLSQTAAGDTSLQLTPAMASVPYGTKILHIDPNQLRISLVAASAPSPQAGR